MMTYNITTDEVRYRLLPLTSADVSDTVLNSASYIPTADAWINDKIGAASIAASSLTTNQKVFAEAAEIAYCAMICVASAPVRGSKAGPIQVMPIPANEKKEMVAILKDEYNRYLALLGIARDDAEAGGFGFSSSGGDDYMPDEEDESQIDFADTEDEFNQFG